MSVELIHVLLALGGMAIGWIIRHRMNSPTPAPTPQPAPGPSSPDLMQMLAQLLQQLLSNLQSAPMTSARVGGVGSMPAPFHSQAIPVHLELTPKVTIPSSS